MTTRLQLPDVTLVAIDCVAHELTEMAIRDSLRAVDFAGVVVCSDKCILDYVPTVKCLCQDINMVSTVLWYAIPPWIRSSHILTVQYDGWVMNPRLWESGWLTYDYVGAPWPWHRNCRVGNGGFSLRSTRLMKFLANHAMEFPLVSGRPEDDLLCRVYRPALETHGFRWASEETARQFSFERERPHATFGFHGLFNWPHVLDRGDLAARMLFANDYVRGRSEWRELEEVMRCTTQPS